MLRRWEGPIQDRPNGTVPEPTDPPHACAGRRRSRRSRRRRSGGIGQHHVNWAWGWQIEEAALEEDATDNIVNTLSNLAMVPHRHTCTHACC